MAWLIRSVRININIWQTLQISWSIPHHNPLRRMWYDGSSGLTAQSLYSYIYSSKFNSSLVPGSWTVEIQIDIRGGSGLQDTSPHHAAFPTLRAIPSTGCSSVPKDAGGFFSVLAGSRLNKSWTFFGWFHVKTVPWYWQMLTYAVFCNSDKTRIGISWQDFASYRCNMTF